MEGYHAASVPSLTARHPARAGGKPGTAEEGLKPSARAPFFAPRYAIWVSSYANLSEMAQYLR